MAYQINAQRQPPVTQNWLWPIDGPKDDRIPDAAYEALRYLTTAAVAAGVAFTASMAPWSCAVMIPALMLYAAYYEKFPFWTIDSIIGSENFLMIAEKTETLAKSLLGSLFSLGSAELGLGVFCAFYGYSLLAAESSLVLLTLGACCIALSLHSLLPSGIKNLHACNVFLQRETNALMQLNDFLREVRRRRDLGDFQLDPTEVEHQIGSLFVSQPNDLLDWTDAGIQKKIRHDPASLTLLLQFLPDDYVASAVIPYFSENITAEYLLQIERSLTSYPSDDEIRLYIRDLRGFLYRLARLNEIEDDRLAPLRDELNALKNKVFYLDNRLQNLPIPMDDLDEAYYSLGTVMKSAELDELAPFLSLQSGTPVFTELAQRGLKTREDLMQNKIWIPGLNQWPLLKARLIDYIDPPLAN
jgi:hypothetical protein